MRGIIKMNKIAKITKWGIERVQIITKQMWKYHNLVVKIIWKLLQYRKHVKKNSLISMNYYYEGAKVSKAINHE
jgi:hypothetical protein